MTKKNVVLLVAFTFIITLVFSISVQSLLAAWDSPASAPTADNVPAPINIGSGTQAKSGKFQANGGLVIQKSATTPPAGAENASIWLIQ